MLRLLAIGKLNKEIAWELGLSESTVSNYVSGLLRILECRNRVELALWSHREDPSNHATQLQ